eukprot:scaffold4729_cov273-Pinguiococcus_pyrenoidosus.AAC.4
MLAHAGCDCSGCPSCMPKEPEVTCQGGCLGDPKKTCEDMYHSHDLTCKMLRHADCDCTGCSVCQDEDEEEEANAGVAGGEAQAVNV